MSALPEAKLSHVGVFVRDMEKMVAFYKEAIGLMVTDKGVTGRGIPATFMSSSPNEHHQLLIAQGRNVDNDAMVINQLSFRVASLDDLKIFHTRLKSMNVDGMRITTHGNAWSIYFFDPEGNKVEVYTATPWYVQQPFGVPFDITEPTQVIIDKTQKMLADKPGYQPVEQWSANMQARLAR